MIATPSVDACRVWLRCRRRDGWMFNESGRTRRRFFASVPVWCLSDPPRHWRFFWRFRARLAAAFATLPRTEQVTMGQFPGWSA